MKRIILYPLTILLFISCNQKPKLVYKYADKEDFLKCINVNNQLYKEALYTFEQDLINYHNTQRSKLTSCYVSFLHRRSNGNINYNEFVSPHTLLVLEALKKDDAFLGFENKKSNLNYKSPVINCISNNIQNEDIKATLNALLSSNSMNSKLFTAAFAPQYNELVTDKYLALYVALDLYYAKLIDIDFTDAE